MKKKKNSSLFTALSLSLALMVMMSATACGSSENEAGGTMGRVTTISSDSLTVDAFSGGMPFPNGEKPEGAPDGDFQPPADGEKPEGFPDGDFQPPADGEKPEGAPDGDFQPPADGEKPEGAPDGDFQPPADGEKPETESKTFKLTDSTSFYRDENGSKTEISSSEIMPGDMVRIVADGDTASEVTVTAFKTNSANDQNQ